MFKHLLIPTDGSELSRTAALQAVKLAKSLGARVTAFFAAPPATPVIYDGFLPKGFTTTTEHQAMIEKTAAKYLGVIEKACVAAGVPCDSVHETNEFPAEAIIALAKKRKCDLVAMASHGRRGLAGIVLGSTAQKVLTQSKIPVLVYR